ncbi:MAG: hypothetical protein PHX59_05045, partial [Sulfuricurvum sp.]|nr:hypothetical protein [Sulfuricurvum sp.]
KVIQESETLVSASVQAVLENLAGGGKPVFLQRPDYSEDFLPLMESLSIPIVRNYSSEQLSHGIKQAALNDYRRIDKSNNKVIEFIRKTFDLEKLKPF